LGRKILDDVITTVGPIAKVESQARMEGRSMTLVLSPDKKAQEALKKAAEEAEKKAAREAAEAQRAAEEADRAQQIEEIAAPADITEAAPVEIPTPGDTVEVAADEAPSEVSGDQ